jgi:hypothetical protein
VFTLGVLTTVCVLTLCSLMSLRSSSSQIAITAALRGIALRTPLMSV